MLEPSLPWRERETGLFVEGDDGYALGYCRLEPVAHAGGRSRKL